MTTTVLDKMEATVLAQARTYGYIDVWDASDAIGAPSGMSRIDCITRDAVDAVSDVILARLVTAGMLRKGIGPYYHPVETSRAVKDE